ncbi:protein IMPACT isoform X5 [Eretmochelys imbricata]
MDAGLGTFRGEQRSPHSPARGRVAPGQLRSQLFEAGSIFAGHSSPPRTALFPRPGATLPPPPRSGAERNGTSAARPPPPATPAAHAPSHHARLRGGEIVLAAAGAWGWEGRAPPRGPMATSDAETAQSQIDEIDALSSIYGDDWCVVDEDERIFCIKISDCLEQPKWTLCLQVILPSEYPAAAPPIYQLNAPWLRGQDYMELANSLEEIYVKNLGESILYLWVEKIREVLIEKSQSSDTETFEESDRRLYFALDNPVKICYKFYRSTPAGPNVEKITEEIDEDDEDDYSLEYQPVQEDTVKTLNFVISESQEDEELPPINHGNPISDRRSTFQAHLAPVVSPKQVKMVLAKLHENKKIANATHNIYAYRIYCEDKQTYLQDCEDDGETAAGGRLLHLMQEESSKQLGKNKRVRKDKKRTEH